MSWVNENKKIARTIILVLFIASLLGPWSYDRINVPAEYTCSLPNIRLYGDFCGLPFLGLQVIPLNAAGFFVIVLEFFMGTFSGRVEQFISGLAILPLLAGFSTLLLIRKPDLPRMSIISPLMWGISCIPPLLIIDLYKIRFNYLWGPWLYVGLAIFVILFEALIVKSRSIRETQSGVV